MYLLPFVKAVVVSPPWPVEVLRAYQRASWWQDATQLLGRLQQYLG